MAVRRGIDKAVDAAIEQLTAMAKPVSSKDEIAQVGAISANNDHAIGDLLADAMEKVGKDGVITVEEGKTTETTLELRRRHAVRQGLHLALLHQPAGRDGLPAGRRADPDPREEDQQSPRAGADFGESQPRAASRC